MRVLILILIGYILRMLVERIEYEYIVKPRTFVIKHKITDPKEIEKIIEKIKRKE